MSDLKVKFDQYFVYRFSDPTEYRGHHFFQHSRYTMEHVLFLLKMLDSSGEIIDPPGDNRDYNEGGKYRDRINKYSDYFDLSIKYKLNFNKGNQFNSIKKHMFPDLEKMGLLVRRRMAGVKYVKISEYGKEFLDEQNPVNKKMKWARAIIMNIQHTSPTFIDSLMELLEKTGYITEDELIYFVSYLDFKEKYDYNHIATLIEYSRIYRKDYESKKRKVKEISLETLSDKSMKKSEQYDDGNFSNSSRSLWNYLQDIIYFDTVDDGVTVKMIIRNTIIYKGNEILFKRDSRIGSKYLENHQLTIGHNELYDYHHIVPLYLAGSVEEKIELDRWQNIICISQNTHAKLTRIMKDNIQLKFVNNNLELVNIYETTGEKIRLINKENSLYNLEVILNDTLHYNRTILDSMGYA